MCLVVDFLVEIQFDSCFFKYGLVEMPINDVVYPADCLQVQGLPLACNGGILNKWLSILSMLKLVLLNILVPADPYRWNSSKPVSVRARI